MRVSLLKNFRKKLGQLGEVKLLPRLESKGVGRELEPVDVAVLMAAVLIGAATPLDDILALVSSCRACSCIGRDGGGLRSKTRSASPSHGSAVCIS